MLVWYAYTGGDFLFLTTFIMLAVVLIFAFTNMKNRYSNIIKIYLLSLLMLSVFAAMYSAKTMFNYTFPLKIDYLTYLLLSGFKIKLSTIREFYNFSFALFMFSSIYGALVILEKRWYNFLKLSIPILMFLILNHPKFLLWLELKQYGVINTTTYDVLLNIIKLFSLATLISYTVLPYIYIFSYYKKVKYMINKQNVRIYLVCISVINLFFYSVFVFGTFRDISFVNLNTANIPITKYHNDNYILIPVMTTVFMITLLFILIYFKPFNLFQFEREKNKNILKNIQLYSENLAMNLHTYKNIFWSTQNQFELIKKAINTNNIDDAVKYADSGSVFMKSQIKLIQSTMEQLTAKSDNMASADIVKCLKDAIANVKKADIFFDVEFLYDHIYVFGDEYALTETFRNLIINSVESILLKGASYKRVGITADVSNNLCIVEITDNGCGIDKENMKNIFVPFFTTKCRTKNSGIGLAFVRNTIELHKGRINISSKPGEYATFQISLPVISNKKRVIG